MSNTSDNRMGDPPIRCKTALSNICGHPTTSITGILLAIVTVANVLLAQGVDLGKLGTGTVISFVISAATALLGLLAKDPGSATEDKRAGSPPINCRP